MSLIQRLTIRNVGTFDRILRAMPFAAFVVLYAGNWIGGTAAIVFGVLAVMLLFTAVTGLCSIYAMLGISTCEKRAN